MTTKQSTKTPTEARRTRDEPGEPTQLRLLDGGRTTPRAWQLDARTRRIGRQRVAEAREILRRAQPPAPTEPRHQERRLSRPEVLLLSGARARPGRIIGRVTVSASIARSCRVAAAAGRFAVPARRASSNGPDRAAR